MNLNHRVRFCNYSKKECIIPNFFRCLQQRVDVTVAVKSIVTFYVHLDKTNIYLKPTYTVKNISQNKL